MSYTKLTDFAAKDALLSGNPSKLLRGTEIGAEFDAIESAMAAAEAVMAAAEAVNITAPIIAASTSKATPVDADVLPILDSAAANILKKVTWANIKATLKTYFDTLYAAVGSFAASGAITSSGLTQATNRMLGRSTAGTGAVEEISIGSGLSLAGGVLDVATPPVSMIRVTGANGYGSTNTVVKRYTTTVTNQGTDITYADSATLGASFTINAAGVYSISGNVVAAVTSSLGISLNSTQLTTSIGNITTADRLIAGYGAGGNAGTVSVSVYLPAGSVIRPHSDGNASTLAAAENFTVTRIG